MSVQFVMMGMMVAGAVMQGLQGKQQAEQAGQQAHGQGMQMLVKGSEQKLNAAEQEQAMWSKALNLLSTNEADAAHRGVGTDPGTSFAAIENHNINVANTMADRMRRVGESGQKMLDMGADQQFRTADYLTNTAAPMALISSIVGGLGKAGSMMSMGGSSGGNPNANIDSDIASWSQYH